MVKNRYYAFIRKNNIYGKLLSELTQLESDGGFDTLRKTEEALEAETFEVVIDEDYKIIDQPVFIQKMKKGRKKANPEDSLYASSSENEDGTRQDKDTRNEYSENEKNLEHSDHNGDSRDYDSLKRRVKSLEELFREAQSQLEELKVKLAALENNSTTAQ
jgi:hypothetical protein